MKHQTDYDVVVIGYGPVGAILALALARQGFTVAVFERWRERYALPRAVCIDHEMTRMLSAIGLGDQLPAVSHPGEVYRWMNAQWRELLAIDWAAESISGGSEVNFVHQPTVEAMFDQAVRQQPNVTVQLGWEAELIEQSADYASATLRDTQTGQTRTVRGRYLVGADGANSAVRRALGTEQEDRGFQADWLVVDVLPHEGVRLDVPAAAQYCNPERPTTIVPAGVRDGRYFRRWEFMRLPHEAASDLENEAAAWRLLAPWVTPDQAVLVRHKLYTFRSLVADRWRRGRLLIAGDAAHVMPPFMGQGMCAGLRDDWNLAWKLPLVLRGQADASLLDTYDEERRPHVSDVIDLSMYLGRIICMPDAQAAAARDAAFFAGTAPPPPPFPSLRTGLLAKDAKGRPAGCAGLLSPHSRGRSAAGEGRFDDLFAGGFRLVHTGGPLALTAAQQAVLAALGVSVVRIEADLGQATKAGEFLESDRKFLPFMREHGAAAMLVRPDFYVYGSVAVLEQAGELVDALARDLARHGFHPPVMAPAAA